MVKDIIIIGAGFAGLRMANLLNNHSRFKITLIDKNNFHQFQPLLYQVAIGGLDASNISFPLRSIFRNSKNVTIYQEEVLEIDSLNHQVITRSINLAYDYLVIATGATTNYYGNGQVQRFAYSMKSTLEALQIRNHLIEHLELASTKDIDLNIVLVGGGPTGVELSGALAELKRDTLAKEYPLVNIERMNIYLLEGSGKLLGNLSEVSSRKAADYLKEMGVIVKTNAMVKSFDGQIILLQDGNIISSSFVIWAAGVKGNYPKGIDNAIFPATQQITVDEFNLVTGSNNIFAIGDIALMTSTLYPKGYPQLASVAIDQATNLAKNFQREAMNQPKLPFKYIDKGSMATIGRHKAVVDLSYPKWSFQGLFAWVIWMSLHLFLLIGFKNKIMVFINWVYKYFIHDQSLSLYFKPLRKKDDENLVS